MLISTNSGYHSGRPNRPRYTMLEMVDFSAELGFEALDVNFSATIYREPFLHEPILDGDWEQNVRAIGERAKARGLRLVQSHLPFYDFSDEAHPDFALREEMTRRSLIACGMLGIPWTVFHPLHSPDSALDERLTLDYLSHLVPLAKANGVGIAMENMTRPNGHFCTTGEGLARVADAAGCGICLDTGHANLTDADQLSMIATLGTRIKVLHVQDNKGVKDDHLPPFLGFVDFAAVMRALRLAGYAGELNFEVNNKAVPEALRPEYGAYLVHCGKLLREMFEKG